MAQNKTVNMIPDGSLPRINLSQNDVGRTFTLTLADGSGAYTVPTGAVIKFQGTKPSGLGFSVECDNTNNVVTVETTEGMTDEWGCVEAELQISKNGVVLGSSNVLLMIEQNPHPDGTTDGQAAQLIPALTVLVERVEAAAESVHDLTVEADTLDASEPASAVYDEENNKITFGIPKGYNGYLIEGTIGFADTSSNGDIVISVN